MTASPELLKELVRHEGKRNDLYDDATGLTIRPGTLVKGNPTIGVGRNLLANPLSDDEVAYLETNDVDKVQAYLDRFPWYAKLNVPRQDALADAGFNMGVGNLLHFSHMIAALSQDPPDLVAAKAALDDPHWRAQVGVRADELAEQLLTGEYPK